MERRRVDKKLNKEHGAKSPGNFKEDVAHGLYKEPTARGRWAPPYLIVRRQPQPGGTATDFVKNLTKYSRDQSALHCSRIKASCSLPGPNRNRIKAMLSL